MIPPPEMLSFCEFVLEFSDMFINIENLNAL